MKLSPHPKRAILDWQVERLVEERVAQVLDSDAVKQSLQERLVQERKV